MAREPKVFCLFCEEKMTPGLSFCPTCGHPSSWASHDERVAWEVDQWRKDAHEPEQPLPVLPAPEPYLHRVLAAAASASSMSEIAFEAPARPPSRTAHATVHTTSRPEPRAPKTPRRAASPKGVSEDQATPKVSRVRRARPVKEKVDAPPVAPEPKAASIPDVIDISESGVVDLVSVKTSVDQGVSRLAAIESRLEAIERAVSPRARRIRIRKG